MDRRVFLRNCSVLAAARPLRAVIGNTDATPLPAGNLRFPDADQKWRHAWDLAFQTVQGNVRQVEPVVAPVLTEGANYPGIWMECAPQESAVYLDIASSTADPRGQRKASAAVARSVHDAFFDLQRLDGQLPAYIRKLDVGFGSVQMVVPIAATAWEVSQQLQDEAFLVKAYGACSRWDAWLRRYRNTRQTGLVEGFCTFDTGMDNSPRWVGMENSCPGEDARQCPANSSLPRLCPDLSATVYGGRMALAAMAGALGKTDDAARWRQDAEAIRRLILERLYCPEDAAFYDVDAQEKFVKVRSVVIHRVLQEHVLRVDDGKDRAVFDAVWTKQIHNPRAFWTKFPFASVAADDPRFDHALHVNSWSGSAQALTALRAPRWMSYYDKDIELRHLMTQWVRAISDAGAMLEQMSPFSGKFIAGSSDGYSPAALVYLDFIRRLSAAKSS